MAGLGTRPWQAVRTHWEWPCEAISLPDGRKAKLPALPIAIDGERPGLRHDAPRVGEHGREVLAEAGLPDGVANVVTGARAAEEAGQALTQIETASTELAQLMETVAAAARDQSAQGGKIADVMKLVREIAVETAGSSQKTSEEVGELTSLSEKLRESVAGFKLPG